MENRIIPLETKRREYLNSDNRQENILNRQELLKYYVHEGTQIFQSLDNLGNFLMGFGVLMLGYLLNVNLNSYFARIEVEQSVFNFSTFALIAWIASIVLLLGFMYFFIFHLISGRTIHAKENSRNSIGKRISITEMTYDKFASTAPTFDAFIAKNYLYEDQKSDTQIWYATFRYSRYMAFQKLMIMNKMRKLIAWAMISGVLFKILDILLIASEG